MANKSWIVQVANQVERYTEKKGNTKGKIICASGISPSGVIHLGNLREIFSVHLVVEELLRRNLPAEHLHFWDDYDRLRKIPANVSPDFEQYIGMPLTSVPDPYGKADSYAQHFKSQFAEQLEILGIRPTYISQTQVYTDGGYNEAIQHAFAHRLEIFDILVEYVKEEDQAEQRKRRAEFYPFKVYCETCNKDDTTIQNYEASTATIDYTCGSCHHSGSYSLNDKVSGKLVWKVDWPMRWKFYDVDYEPGGVDHSTPGSSYTVGKEIVQKVMGGPPPHYVGYAFVGLTGGEAKISSSAGSIATPENALKILEPAMLRWLYSRANIRSSFNINFDKQVFQIYDEWDRLMTKVESGKAKEMEAYIAQTCTQTSTKEVAYSKDRLQFRMLCSAVDLTSNNRSEIIRIVSEQTGQPFDEASFAEKAGLRFEKAANWVNLFQPEEEKIKIKDQFDQETFAGLDAQLQDGIKRLLEGLEDHWSLSDLSTFLYKVPKELIGHPLDAKPTPELKDLQRKFFVSIYHLILGEDTGPRLPTLFVSLGKERIRKLLGGGDL